MVTGQNVQELLKKYFVTDSTKPQTQVVLDIVIVHHLDEEKVNRDANTITIKILTYHLKKFKLNSNLFLVSVHLNFVYKTLNVGIPNQKLNYPYVHPKPDKLFLFFHKHITHTSVSSTFALDDVSQKR